MRMTFGLSGLEPPRRLPATRASSGPSSEAPSTSCHAAGSPTMTIRTAPTASPTVRSATRAVRSPDSRRPTPQTAAPTASATSRPPSCITTAMAGPPDARSTTSRCTPNASASAASSPSTSGSHDGSGPERSNSPALRPSSIRSATAAIAYHVSAAVAASAPRDHSTSSATITNATRLAASGAAPRRRLRGRPINPSSRSASTLNANPSPAYTTRTSAEARMNTTGSCRSSRKASSGMSRQATKSPASSPTLSEDDSASLIRYHRRPRS